VEAGTELSRRATLDRRRLTWVRSRALRTAARVNLPLAAIVLAGFALTAYFTLRVTQWMIMTDELQHVKLAISIADTLNPLPRVRGAGISAYAQLYPLLTAPVYGLFDMTTAFKVVKGLNTLLMASTAIPAYLLCRDALGSKRMAWLVAALTAAVPWMAMASLMMTEVAAYPAFVWAVYLTYRATISPSARNDVLALVAIAIAVLARTQFIFLGGVLPVVVLAHELGFARIHGDRLRSTFRRVVREHRVLTITTGLGLVAFVALKAAGKLGSILGNYSDTVTGSLFPHGTASFSAQLWAATGVGIGVIPMVAAVAWALPTLVRPSNRRGHAYAVVFTVTAAVLTWQVASFLVRYSGTSVQDRYFFYVVPLLFVGMAACLRDARARPIPILIAAGVFAWLTTLIDLTPTVARPFWASPPVVLNRAITFRSHQLGDVLGFSDLRPGPVVVVVSVLLGAALAFALWRLPRRRVLLATGAFVLVVCVAATGYTDHRFKQNMSAEPLTNNNWVDQRLPDGAHAALVPGGLNSTAGDQPIQLDLWTDWNIWWHAEFWNKTATRELRFEDDPVGSNTPFAQAPVTADRRTGALTVSSDTPYIVVSHSDVRRRIHGETLEVNQASGLELLRMSSPPRLDWITEGLPFDGGTPAGEPVKIRVFAQPGASRRMRTLTVTADQADTSDTNAEITLAANGTTKHAAVPIGGHGTASIALCTRAPYTDATLDVPTLRKGKPIAVHVAKITLGPPTGACRRADSLSSR
jgi:hypothetical protein